MIQNFTFHVFNSKFFSNLPFENSRARTSRKYAVDNLKRERRQNFPEEQLKNERERARENRR